MKMYIIPKEHIQCTYEKYLHINNFFFRNVYKHGKTVTMTFVNKSTLQLHFMSCQNRALTLLNSVIKL